MPPENGLLCYGFGGRQLCKPLGDKYLIKRRDKDFFVGIVYERLPAFCMKCGIISHNMVMCRKLIGEDNVRRVGEQKESRNQQHTDNSKNLNGQVLTGEIEEGDVADIVYDAPHRHNASDEELCDKEKEEDGDSHG